MLLYSHRYYNYKQLPIKIYILKFGPYCLLLCEGTKIPLSVIYGVVVCFTVLSVFCIV